MTEAISPPNKVPWPPVIYVVAVAVAIILQVYWPLPWIGSPLGDMLFAVGWLMAAGAVAIDVFAMRTLGMGKTTVMPTRVSDHLVTKGPFAISRNPIYLGNTALMVAIGLIAGSVWFIILAPVAAALTTSLAIKREERHLAERFGKRYRDYAKKVRRWI